MSWIKGGAKAAAEVIRQHSPPQKGEGTGGIGPAQAKNGPCQRS